MENVITNNLWHFLCLTWNGRIGHKMKFYHQGFKMDEKTIHNTSISQGGKFLIGATKDYKNGPSHFFSDFVGTISCLNIWSVTQPYYCILAMSSGAMNINGNVLAWRDLLGMIVNNLTIIPNTIIYYPGK